MNLILYNDGEKVSCKDDFPDDDCLVKKEIDPLSRLLNGINGLSNFTVISDE